MARHGKVTEQPPGDGRIYPHSPTARPLVTETMAVDSVALAPSRGLLARLVGVLLSPRATYAEVAKRPRWFGALAVVVLVGAGGAFFFLSTEVGRAAVFDQQVRQAESFRGRPMTDAEYQRLERMLPLARYFAVGAQLIALPLAAAVIAGIAFGVFNAMMGGDAAFKQVFAVIAHSGVVIALAQLFALPLDYVRETMTSPTSLAVFLPFLDEGSFPARFLSVIDLFQVWWIVSFAIGLGVLYRKRTGPIAFAIMSIYVVVALVIAAIRSAA